MKFAVFAIVVLALAASAHSSIIPLGLGGAGPILAVSGPHDAIPGIGSVAIQAPVLQAPTGSVAVQVPNTISLHAIPSAIAVAPAAVAVPAPVVVAAEGTYVAKTRGAVHVAPLPGHIQSASSVNLQPAPGTL